MNINLKTTKGSHYELVSEFPGLIIEEGLMFPVNGVEANRISGNELSSTTNSNIRIAHNAGLFDDYGDTQHNNTPSNPTTTPDDKESDENDNTIEKVKPPEGENIELVIVESDYKDIVNGQINQGDTN